MTVSRLEKSSFFEVPFQEVQSRVSDFEADIERVGPLAILENRNTCFTVLNSEKTDQKVALKIYGILISCFRQQICFVRETLEAEELDHDQKDQHRRAIKTYVNLLAIIANNRITNSTPKIIPKKGRQKKAEITNNASINSIWLAQADKFLDLLIELFGFSFHQLWQPPIVEEDFLRTIVSFIFKLLEDANISKIKHILVSLSTLLGLILSKHTALLVVTLKLINIVQHIDNQVNNMCFVVQKIVSEFSYPHIIVQLFKEIAQNCGETAPDSASSRNIALFVAQLSLLLPKDVLNNSSLLMCHLELDPYSMRNAVLECFGVIIVKILSHQEMDESSKKTRNSFLDKIQEHFHDVNAYVRSKSLAIYADLVKNRALPICRYNLVTDLCIKRLNDKSCHVRKNATSFLFQLIVNNPYSQYLSIKELEAKISSVNKENNLAFIANSTINYADSLWEQIIADVKNLFKISDNEDQSSYFYPEDLSSEIKMQIISELSDKKLENAVHILSNQLKMEFKDFIKEYSSSSVLKALKTILFEHISMKIVHGEINQENISDDILQINQATGTYLKNALNFAKSIKSSMVVIFRLLQSETISDILEVVQFTKTAYRFGICELREILDNILPLIWSSESSLKTALIEASMEILLFSPHTKDKEILIDNLFSNLKNCSLGFSSAIEELLTHMSEKNILPQNFIKSLWLIHSSNESSGFQKRQSVKILGMLVRGSPSIFDQNLEILSSVGFSQESSITLSISTAVAIINYSNSKKRTDSLTRLDINHVLFRKLKSYIVCKFSSLKFPLWSILFEHSIKIFILLSNSPFLLLNDILKEIITANSFNINEPENRISISYVLLGRILHALSHTAIGVLLLLEGDFLTELKRRSSIIQKSTNQVRKKSKGGKLSLSTTIDDNEDPFVIGATADETEADFVKELCDNEIIHQNNIFFQFFPIIMHILDKSSSYPSDLVCSASLALSKFMLISSEFCSKHLQMMFTLLSKSNLEIVKINMVILIGDIIQRFPNLVEPWMSSVFACLRDKSSNFRRVVLSVLSSLILNDMVKIKGHISELALCIEDEDLIIATRTRLFFSELSRKDNAIYNILPDVISRLSNRRESLDRALFEKVMKFLLKFLQKEKHCESLVDKLCNRFSLSHNITEQLDIVYCFQQLNLSEKSFKKLAENFPSFKDKIYDDQLFENFLSVITKFKKSAREEAKVFADEFEQKISQAHVRGINEENLNESFKLELEQEKVSNKIQSLTLVDTTKSPKRSAQIKKENNSKKSSPVLRKRTRRGKKLITSIQEETESDTPSKKKT